jgi:ribonuclease HII
LSTIVAGVDEAGVGPIAGPVIAAAVILNPAKKIYKLRDSKILSPKQREILYTRIIENALCTAVGISSLEEIDRLNIFHATMLAMQRAISNLKIIPSLVLIDGRSKPSIDLPVQTIVGGDRTVKCISAASIIAKVTRDRIMCDYHEKLPLYCFNKHKGYSTKQHQELVRIHGISPIHKYSFSFVKQFLTK